MNKRTLGGFGFSILALGTTCFLFSGCAAKLDCSGDPCDDAKSICKEARDTRAEYDSLSDDEKREMSSVVSTYAEHCDDATERCEKCKAK